MSEQERDDELATLTDAIMEGRMLSASEDMAELAAVVQKVHRVIRPDETPAFQAQLAERLHQEWQRTHREPIRLWQNRRTMQIVSIAATITLLFFVALALTGGDGGGLEGTALGGSVWILLAGIAAVGGFIWFIMQRNR